MCPHTSSPLYLHGQIHRTPTTPRPCLWLYNLSSLVVQHTPAHRDTRDSGLRRTLSRARQGWKAAASFRLPQLSAMVLLSQQCTQPGFFSIGCRYCRGSLANVDNTRTNPSLSLLSSEEVVTPRLGNNTEMYPSLKSSVEP